MRQHDNEPPLLALLRGRQPRLTPDEWVDLLARGYIYVVIPGGIFLTDAGMDLAEEMEIEERYIAAKRRA
ncbi:MAG: hypothetical protein KGL39_40595 [Patescibacteria group bacterium]|nr:hypothetical protein [Patescibacteria group bacterium]